MFYLCSRTWPTRWCHVFSHCTCLSGAGHVCCPDGWLTYSGSCYLITHDIFEDFFESEVSSNAFMDQNVFYMNWRNVQRNNVANNVDSSISRFVASRWLVRVRLRGRRMTSPLGTSRVYAILRGFNTPLYHALLWFETYMKISVPKLILVFKLCYF